MNTTVPITPASPSWHLPVIEFGHSADGLLVARVGDTAFAMVPTRQGRHFLATGWRLTRPLDTWKRGDFYGHSGDVADEAAFRALVAESAKHQRERVALGRREIASRANTPWGPSHFHRRAWRVPTRTRAKCPCASAAAILLRVLRGGRRMGSGCTGFAGSLHGL